MRCETCDKETDVTLFLEVGDLKVCEECYNKTKIPPHLANTLRRLTQLNSKEVKQMATLKEEAMAYEPRQTLNIADLELVPVTLEVREGKGTRSDGSEFKYKYVELNGKEYRIPNSVLEELKKIVKLKPEVENVKVTRKGTGLATKYSVEAA